MGVSDGSVAMSSVAGPRQTLHWRRRRRVCDEINCRASPTLHGRWRRRRCDEFNCRASPLAWAFGGQAQDLSNAACIPAKMSTINWQGLVVPMVLQQVLALVSFQLFPWKPAQAQTVLVIGRYGSHGARRLEDLFPVPTALLPVTFACISLKN